MGQDHGRYGLPGNSKCAEQLEQQGVIEVGATDLKGLELVPVKPR